MGKNRNKPNKIQANVNEIIPKLINSITTGKFPITLQECKTICLQVRQQFVDEDMLLRLDAPINICGDLHGQFQDLLRIFQQGGEIGESKYLFLGDYVDRGKQSLECITLLFAYKLKYPNSIFLLRGNHEDASITKTYGFFDECKRKLTVDIWKFYIDAFNTMPVAAVISDRIFCSHGGISPQLEDLSQIEQIKRPTEVPQSGLLCDILWSDPSSSIPGWAPNKERTISYTFGFQAVQSFLNNHEFDLICRAHEVVQKGYQFYFQRKLVTVFSASNYTGQFDNLGAILVIDQYLKCSYLQYKCQLNKNKKKKK